MRRMTVAALAVALTPAANLGQPADQAAPDEAVEPVVANVATIAYERRPAVSRDLIRHKHRREREQTRTMPATTLEAAPPRRKRRRFVTVRRGDTVAAIAQRHNMRPHRLARLNRLRRAWHIEAGDRLRIVGPVRWHGKVQLARPEPKRRARPVTRATRVRTVAACPVKPAAGGYTTYAGHTGVDINEPGWGDLGNPVVSMCSGVVVETHTWGHSYGWHVVVAQDDGRRLIYAHLSAILVRVGQRVAAGQIVGRVGNTGNSSGPHLHVEVAGEGYAGTLAYLP